MKCLVKTPEFHSQGSPNWSTDGKFIAFDAWQSQKAERFFNGHMIVVNADGTNMRDLGPGNVPSLSPKGNRVAYCRQGNQEDRGIWITSVGTPDESKLKLDDQGWGVEWSPDGIHVAYARNNNLMIIRISKRSW